jgi:hypothetical protein
MRKTIILLQIRHIWTESPEASSLKEDEPPTYAIASWNKWTTSEGCNAHSKEYAPTASLRLWTDLPWIDRTGAFRFLEQASLIPLSDKGGVLQVRYVQAWIKRLSSYRLLTLTKQHPNYLLSHVIFRTLDLSAALIANSSLKVRPSSSAHKPKKPPVSLSRPSCQVQLLILLLHVILLTTDEVSISAIGENWRNSVFDCTILYQPQFDRFDSTWWIISGSNAWRMRRKNKIIIDE